jgi:hypothetical protein
VKRFNEDQSCVEFIHRGYVSHFMYVRELTSGCGNSVSSHGDEVINFKARVMECRATGPDCSNE